MIWARSASKYLGHDIMHLCFLVGVCVGGGGGGGVAECKVRLLEVAFTTVSAFSV